MMMRVRCVTTAPRGSTTTTRRGVRRLGGAAATWGQRVATRDRAVRTTMGRCGGSCVGRGGQRTGASVVVVSSANGGGGGGGGVALGVRRAGVGRGTRARSAFAVGDDGDVLLGGGV